MSALDKDLILLKIRSLIADKEYVVAEANRELSMGGWRSDHGKSVSMINAEIEALIKQCENRRKR